MSQKVAAKDSEARSTLRCSFSRYDFHRLSVSYSVGAIDMNRAGFANDFFFGGNYLDSAIDIRSALNETGAPELEPREANILVTRTFRSEA